MNVPPRPRATDDETRMPDGRYAGLTFTEIDALPGGRKYLQVIAKREGRFREVASQYLAALQ